MARYRCHYDALEVYIQPHQAPGDWNGCRESSAVEAHTGSEWQTIYLAHNVHEILWTNKNKCIGCHTYTRYLESTGDSSLLGEWGGVIPGENLYHLCQVVRNPPFMVRCSRFSPEGGAGAQQSPCKRWAMVYQDSDLWQWAAHVIWVMYGTGQWYTLNDSDSIFLSLVAKGSRKLAWFPLVSQFQRIRKTVNNGEYVACPCSQLTVGTKNKATMAKGLAVFLVGLLVAQWCSPGAVSQGTHYPTSSRPSLETPCLGNSENAGGHTSIT